MELVFDYERDMEELIASLDFLEGNEGKKRKFLEKFFRSLIFC